VVVGRGGARISRSKNVAMERLSGVFGGSNWMQRSPRYRLALGGSSIAARGHSPHIQSNPS